MSANNGPITGPPPTGISTSQNTPPTQQTNLNALVAKKETPTETQKTEDKTADPFLRLKIELRKMGVNPEEIKAFIEVKEIKPEEVEIWLSDMGALKTTYENYKEAKAAFAA